MRNFTWVKIKSFFIQAREQDDKFISTQITKH